MTDPEIRRRKYVRRAVPITLGCGLVTLLVCLGINLMVDEPIAWFWLVVACLFVMTMVGSYLWVRLSRDA